MGGGESKCVTNKCLSFRGRVQKEGMPRTEKARSGVLHISLAYYIINYVLFLSLKGGGKLCLGGASLLLNSNMTCR